MRKKTYIDIPAITPDLSKGLTLAEAKQRKENGLSNKKVRGIEKSDARIIVENAFTFFNCVLYAIAALLGFFMIYLTVTGETAILHRYFGFTKFLFLVIALANVAIGSFQGIRSKRMLAKLRIVLDAKAVVVRDGEKQTLSGEEIVRDDILILSSGEQCLVDMEVLSGEIKVNESLLTGESEAVKKTKGDKIYAGSLALSGQVVCVVKEVGEKTYAETLSSKVKALSSHESELMKSIRTILNAMAFILFGVVAIVIITLAIKISIRGEEIIGPGATLGKVSTWALIFVTTSGFAIGVIPTGLALITSVTLAVSILRLAKQKTLIQELYSLENLSRADIICLDKTGTLTDGTMKVVRESFFHEDAKEILQQILGSQQSDNLTSAGLSAHYGKAEPTDMAEVIPFSSDTKCSGFLGKDGKKYLMGAPEYILKKDDERLSYPLEEGKLGRRVIAFTVDGELYGFVSLEEGIRASAKDTLAFFYDNDVDVRIISGDSVATVSKIASICGVNGAEKAISLENVAIEEIPNIVDEYVLFCRVSPEKKQALVEALQSKGHRVAMTGDGVNDILALRKANASITFASATDAAKSCADVVLLDDDFCHLKEVVGEGRRVVNNIERTAILFLMKTAAVALLSIALIFFPAGQLAYSLENIYLLEISVIAGGGFLLSLEMTRKRIEGSFMKNVLSKAAMSAAMLFLGAFLPILLYHLGVFGPMGRDGDAWRNMASLISLLTSLSGFSVLLVLCMPFNKYRAISAIIVGGLIVLLALAVPSVFVGAQSLRFADVPTLFAQAFQPWRAPALLILFVKDDAPNVASMIVLGVFAFVLVPAYAIAMKKLAHKSKLD